MYNYSPAIRGQQAIWDVVQKSLLSPNVYPNAGLSPQQSPSMPGFFAQPGSSVYSKSIPAPPSAEESAARIRRDIGQQEAQIFQNLQSIGLPPSVEGYGQALRSISKATQPQTMGGVMTIDQATGVPNYLIQPTPINQPGGIQDYSPPVSVPTPQQPSIYGTEKTPYAIPKMIAPGVYGQESEAEQKARIQKPVQLAQAEINAAYKSQNPEYVRFAVTKHQGAEAGNKAAQDMITNQQAGFKQKQDTELKKRELFQTGELAKKATAETEATKRITGIEKLYDNALSKATKSYEVHVGKIEKQQEKYQEFVNEYEDAQAMDIAEAEKEMPAYFGDKEAIRVRKKYAKYGFDKITSLPEIPSFEEYMAKYQPQAYKAMQGYESAISNYYNKGGTEAPAPKSKEQPKTTTKPNITEEAFKAFDATYPNDNETAIQDINQNQAEYEAQGVDVVELKRKILERK